MSIPGDVAAKWRVCTPDGVHMIVFEHGTASGKRVVRVDGKEVLRKNWMFSLIGKETFLVGRKSATITIEGEGLSFTYILTINGQTLKQYIEAHNKQMRTWLPTIAGQLHRIVLDTKTMDVYVDGTKTETVGKFVDNGSENHFKVGSSHSAYIKTFSSGDQHKGMLYTLVAHDIELEPVVEVVPDD